MSIDQIIALSASVGACLSAFATFLTIREMAEQRRISYIPELVVCRTDFAWEFRKADSIRQPDSMHPDARLKVVNAGRGAARNLRIRWHYPIEYGCNRINDMARRGDSFIHVVNHENIAVEVVTCNDPEEIGSIEGVFGWRSQRSGELDYVLPHTDQHDIVEIKLPMTPLALTYAMVLASIKASFDWSPLPEIGLEIAFDDICGQAHSIIYRIAIDVWSLDKAKARVLGRLIPYRHQTNSISLTELQPKEFSLNRIVEI